MLILKDNFFKDPYEVRRDGLHRQYNPSPGYTYPGYRSFSLLAGRPISLPPNLANYITDEVRYFSKNPSLKMQAGGFQYVTKDFITGIYHFDTEHTFSSIIFLSLDPPDNSGTEVSSIPEFGFDFDDVWDRSMKVRTDFHKDPSNFINAYKYRRAVKSINSKSKEIIQIPNKFNRFMMFDSYLFHRAQDFFGTSIEDSRLTIVSFFG